MRLWTRRAVIASLGGLAGSVGLSSYAFAIEPRYRLKVTQYAPRPVGWPADLPLRIALLCDFHVGEPHMSLARVADIVEATNALKPDIVLLGGDFVATNRFVLQSYAPDVWAEILGRLRSPLGTFAVLGNHDWWHGGLPKLPPDDAAWVRRALRNAGIPVLENDALSIPHGGRSFWLLGLGDQLAYYFQRRQGPMGIDDLSGTLAKVTDDAPALLLAHEPDIFPRVPARVSLTMSGHTHGGQVRLFGYSPVVPSSYGNRYAYGHVREGGRDLVVSGGLGTSMIPVRLGVPPEVVLITLGDTAPAVT